MRIKTYLTVVCLFFIAWGGLNAQQTQYIGSANGDWFDAANWNNGLPANGNDALIGGGASVIIGAPLTIDFTITNFGGITANAAVTNDGTIANSSVFDFGNSGSLINNAIFNNFSSSTFSGPATFVNEVGATFTNSGTFVLQTTFENKGGVTNNGTIDAASGTLLTEGSFDNSQTLTTESLTITDGSNFTNNFGSNLFITGAAALLKVDGNFNNFGNVEATGTFEVNGIFTNNTTVVNQGTLTIAAAGQFNNAGGTVTNEGDALNLGTFINGFQLLNTGSFVNDGALSNNNLIDNGLGAVFTSNTGGTISMGFGSKIQNAGTFNINGVYDGFGAIENTGDFNNNGTINSFSGSRIDNDGTFTNGGTINSNDQVNNNADFFNDGTIDVNGGSTWRNTGSFTNGINGEITNLQDFENKSTGSLTNNGRFTNLVRTLNEGTFINNAFLENMGILTNESGAILSNNELFSQSSGILLNKGALDNNRIVTSDDCSTISNDGTITNLATLTVHAIVFQRGTLAGAPIDCIGCYVHTNATSNAPAICQDVTFGANIDGEVKVYAPELIAFANFDSCANIVYLANGEGRPVFDCSDIGTNINANIVLRVPNTTDSLTCTAVITPIDVLEPQFDACPKDIVVFTDQGTVAVNWTVPNYTDNCTTTSVVNSHDPGDAFPIGITGVTYTASDDYNNENSCQFRVDVRQTPPGSGCNNDVAGPSFIGCPEDINLVTTGTNINATWVAPTASDNCYPLFINTDFVPGQLFGIGTTTVTYSAVDGNDNESICEFDVVVTFNDPCAVDNTAPSFINCPISAFLPANVVTGGAVATWTAPNVFDLCGVANITSDAVSGSVFPAGSTTVTYLAEDVAGNTASCSFVISVGNDPCPDINSSPSYSNCPANIVVQSNGSSEVVSWTPPTASGACQPLSENSNYSPGATFQVGQTNVNYQVSDAKGNTDNCSFTITVEGDCTSDSESPVIVNCPSDITVASINGTGIANWTEPTASDNCGLVTFSASFSPGSSFATGVTTVVYTAGDLFGNGATCEFNISVVEAPDCNTNSSPIDQSTEIEPASLELSWSASLNADRYDVYLDTNNPPVTLIASDVNATTTTVSNLQGGVSYYWYVVPKNIAGSASGCASNVTTFATAGGGTGSGCNFEALFLASSTSLNSSDAGAKSRLEALGFNVTVVDDDQSTTADADGKGLIFISSTVLSGKVNTKYRDVNIPVVCYESYLFDDFKMTSTGAGSNYGTTSGKAINITNSGHPIAAGLSGTFDVFTTSRSMTWGKPTSAAASIAVATNDASRKLIFAYEEGASMAGLTAPARRVGFFLTNSTVQYLTNDGKSLFDEAVKWAVGLETPGSACNDGNPNTENDVILADGCTCQGTSCDGAILDIAFYDLDNGTTTAIQNGGVYNLNELPANYNIEALTSGSIGSVNFNISGTLTDNRTENYIPYRYPSGDTNPVVLTPGNYNIVTTVWSQSATAGIQCDQVSVNFDIIDTPPCPTALPDVTVQTNNESCNEGNGSIEFAFPDNPNRTNIEFSIDGGNSYPYNVSDQIGSTSVDHLSAGDYDIWVRWGNNECPVDLGIVTIENSNSLYVTFDNQAACEVEVYWFNGTNEILYNSLAAGASYVQQTFVNHVWRVRNAANNELTNEFAASNCSDQTFTIDNCGANTCDNVTYGGTIDLVCQGENLQFISGDSPSGGSGDIEYLWISGTTDCDPANMVQIGNSGSTSELVMPAVDQVTYIIRCSRRAGCSNWDGESNCITIYPSDCTTPVTCDNNLFVNPGFENGTSGLTTVVNAGTSASHAYNGNAGLSICNDWGEANQNIIVLGGETYTFQGFAKKSNDAGWTGIGLTYYDQNWVSLGQNSVEITSTSFEQYAVTVDLPSNASIVTAWIYKDPGGCAYLDDMCLSGTGAATACSDNLLANLNGDFENDLADWDWINNSSVNTTDVYAGTASGEVCGANGGAGNQQSIIAGATYTLNAFAKVVDAPNWAGVGLAFYDANWQKIGNDYVREITATDWTNYTVQVVAPANAAFIDCFYWKDTNGCLLIDDFCLSADGATPQILQTGKIEIEQANASSWYTVNFSSPFNTTPIVILGPPSANSTEQVIPRLRNVTASSFEFQLDEWNYLNGYHPNETLYYMAMTPGNHVIDGVEIEAGSFTANHGYGTKSFDQSFSSKPVVLTTVASYNDANAVAPRTRNINNSSFQFKLQEEDVSSHGNETIHYIALEVGTFDQGGAQFKVANTANSVTHNWYPINFGQNFSDPGFVASMQTVDGGDVCAIRHRNLDNSGVEVFVEEEQSRDSEVNHTSEIVGWVTFSATTTLNLVAHNNEDLDLEAVKEEEHAVLYWTHNKGADVATYTLERSIDGVTFEPLASMTSTGTNQTELYENYDLAPLTGENLYRVQLTYTDGTTGYSDVVSVYYTDLVDFTLFPNPANDFVKINLEEIVGMEHVDITLFNSIGVLVQREQIDKVYGKYFQLDLRDLKEGHYVVWLHAPGRKPMAKQLIIGKF